jgi:hypothetical protein
MPCLLAGAFPIPHSAFPIRRGFVLIGTSACSAKRIPLSLSVESFCFVGKDTSARGRQITTEESPHLRQEETWGCDVGYEQ